MKTNHFLPAIIIVFTILSGCKKVQDVIGNHRLCKIKTLKTFNPDYPPGRTSSSFRITYNNNDNLVTATDDIYTKYYFRYDKKNRLSDYIYSVPYSTYVYEWHTYTYKPGDRVVIDTVYNYSGESTDLVHPNSASYSSENTYDLDNTGRITRITTRYSFAGGSDIMNFVYDTRGNLVRQYSSNGVVNRNIKYDDKVNLWQTNKVLQFIQQDYSVNNAKGATAYNQFGLPLKIVDSTDFYHPTIFGEVWKELEVEYDCDAKETSGK